VRDGPESGCTEMKRNVDHCWIPRESRRKKGKLGIEI
jgi:hypothetical protein